MWADLREYLLQLKKDCECGAAMSLSESCWGVAYSEQFLQKMVDLEEAQLRPMLDSMHHASPLLSQKD